MSFPSDGARDFYQLLTGSVSSAHQSLSGFVPPTDGTWGPV